MRALALRRPSPIMIRLSPALQTTVAVLGSVAVAVVVGYGMHHVGPGKEHAVWSAALGVALALLLIGAPAAVLASRRTMPAVVVARPGTDRVRATTHEDLQFCATVHAELLPHGFFTRLGPRFLRGYHRTFVDSPHAVSFVATFGDTPVGVLVGTLRPRAHSRWVLRRRGLRLAALGALGLAIRPVTAAHFVRTRMGRYARGWRRDRSSNATHAPRGDDPAILTHVAVLPGARGTGAGRRLVSEFMNACRGESITRATLVTLDSAEGASGFYARLGWHRERVHTTADGNRMIEWNVSLTSGRPL